MRCRIEIPRYVASGSAVFSGVPDSQLLNYGVPAEWLDDVREAADEDAILTLAVHLPAEATEALLALATGSTPERLFSGSTDGDPFAHPDAQRRFRVMSNQEELRRALEYPWEKWTVFLHPAQRQVVERTCRGSVGGLACPNGSGSSSGRSSPRWPPLSTSAGS